MSQTIDNIIREYVVAIRKIYGSHARGDFREDSDVDIMLLVDLPDEKLSNVFR